MQDSLGNDGNGHTATVSLFQTILWDMFSAFGIFTATCCLTLHRAGLNDLRTPISIEYAEGNRLAIIFFFTSLGLILVTGLLYRCYGGMMESLLLFGALLFLAIVIASKPHSIVHFYSFYATVVVALLAPLFAVCRLKMWSCFLGLLSISITVILLLHWAATTNLGIGGFGIAQRAWFIVAWLSNASVLVLCQQVALSRKTAAARLTG